MNTRYAAQTEVPADRSRSEIERLLVRYGATAFQYGWEGDKAAVGFRIDSRYVRILMPMPQPGDVELTAAGKMRSEAATLRAHEQAVRQRWRALALIIKAKLEAVASGISTVEREFMSDIVLPNNETVGQWLAPQIEAAYQGGKMPLLLPGS